LCLETGTYISDLVSSNPPAADPVGQGADHIRLIKSCIKATFPNINGAVTATEEQLNSASTGLVPVGGVIMWSGAVAPSGWALCDGGTYAKLDGSGNIVAPDLSDKFVICQGGSHAYGSAGGASSNTPAITVNTHVLTQAELPNVNFTVTDLGHVHGVTDPGHKHNAPDSANLWAYKNPATLYATSGIGPDYGPQYGAMAVTATGLTVNSGTTGISVASGGSGTGHGHTASSAAVPTVPPYYTLAFIIKL
jgi:hypothetical protein